MRYRWLICGLLMQSCGGLSQNVCRTPCGMLMSGGEWSCQEFRRAEWVAMEEFSKTVADTRLRSCEVLANYKVEVQPTASWIQESSGRRVSGETYCEERRILVGQENINESSLAHEMAHALQQCVPLPPRDNDDYYHSNWGRDGIRDALLHIEVTK